MSLALKGFLKMHLNNPIFPTRFLMKENDSYRSPCPIHHSLLSINKLKLTTNARTT